jgi:NAD(P)H-dependent FMN reductase
MTEQDQSKETPLEVIAICGSLRAGSYTLAALRLALQGAQALGAGTHLIDLRDYELVFCDGKQNERHYPPDVFKLRRTAQQAQGIILGTPEYHGGPSGVLKNALDLMGFDEFQGKVIGLVGTAGGQVGATNALNSLRTVGRSLRAWVIPQQVSIPQAWQVFDRSGQLKDPELEKRLLDVGQAVARFAYLLTSRKSLEFLQQWEQAHLNPGG